MATVEVDFDVFKELTVRRTTEAMTYNDVIRELLRLPPIDHGTLHTGGPGWVQKGVSFPDGTTFRAVHKGTTHIAEVKERRLSLNGRKMSSLSVAARVVTGTNVNGWRFWHCRLPNSSGYVLADSLRK